MVHGDDFTSSASRSAAKWFRDLLEKRFEVNTKVIGSGTDEVREERVLNRILRDTDDGWVYEADQRHADLIIKSTGIKSANGIRTTGEDERAWDEDEND